MRLLFSFLLLIFLFSSRLFAQDLDIYFTVQVAAAKVPIDKTDKMFGDLPNLKEMSFSDGYYRYFTGNFKAYHSAEEYLKRVKSIGYNDAFVLAIKNNKERIPADKAIELIYGE